MGKATSPSYNLTVNGVAGRLGNSGDVWEKATQDIGEPFTKAYGFVSGDVITWRLTKKSKPTKMTGEGGLPDGWGLPPSSWVPSGGGLAPEASEPDMEPEINPPEAIPEPTEALIDGTELQVEPEEEPEDPEPEGEPEEEPEDPEPDAWEDEDNPEDTPEGEDEIGDAEDWEKGL